jgi:hypothetical protein
VIRPAHVVGVVSDKGRDDVDLLPMAHLALHSHRVRHHLDVAAFGIALDAALQNQTAGYVMGLNQHGRKILSQHHNWAHSPSDGSERWSLDVPMHVASVSKFITGLAMTRLMHDKGISFDSAIAAYLPAYWSQGPGIASITFRELMTHTSGFTSGGCDLLSVEAQVAAGVPGTGVYHYANTNYSLCRILLAVIHGNISVDVSFPSNPALNDPVWDLATIKAYHQYATKHIFHPSEADARFDHLPEDALAYPFPVTGNGWNSGDLKEICGAAGWHASVHHLLKIMGTFRREDRIVSRLLAQNALDSLFGIDWKISTPIAGASLYTKNGIWEDGQGRMEQSLIYFLPEDMEMVVLANSPIGTTGQFFSSVVTNAYLANIV